LKLQITTPPRLAWILSAAEARVSDRFALDLPAAACDNRSMSRHRLLLFALVSALAVAAVCTAVVWLRPSAITRDNEARIHEGMMLD